MMIFNVMATTLAAAATVWSLATPPSGVNNVTPAAVLTTRYSITPWKTGAGGLICLDGVGGARSTVEAGISAIRDRIAKDGAAFGITPISKNNGKCVRMSCSYNLGIYACNDADEMAITTFETLAVYADMIMGACLEKTNGAWVHGQQFAADSEGRWNVIIRPDKC